MLMRYDFKFYDYVCLHQYYYARSIRENDASTYFYSENNMGFMKKLIDENIADFVNQLEAENNKNELLVLDMRRMKRSPIHKFSSIYKLLSHNRYKGICFLQDDPEIRGDINTAFDNWKKDNPHFVDRTIPSGGKYFGDNTTLTKLINRIKSTPIFSIVDDDINDYIFQWHKNMQGKESSPALIKLYSSNIYANRYFDAKLYLTDGAMFNLVTYRMAIMIHESMKLYKLDSFDAFICASITGACLAIGLSSFFHKPVIFLKNVGPSITANDEKMIARIRKDDKFVFVFDFMCMGKEYERMKMLCNLTSSKIACCAGISYFRLPRFEEAVKKPKKTLPRFDWNLSCKISALFHINAFETDYYSCYVKK